MIIVAIEPTDQEMICQSKWERGRNGIVNPTYAMIVILLGRGIADGIKYLKSSVTGPSKNQSLRG
jgi:hypothetical protein